MTDDHHHDRGPGLAWLAARTGKDLDELLAAPGTSLGDALRELAKLAAQAEADEPEAREAAEAELGALREEIAAAPHPSGRCLSTVAGVLREAAERLGSARPPAGGQTGRPSAGSA